MIPPKEVAMLDRFRNQTRPPPSRPIAGRQRPHDLAHILRALGTTCSMMAFRAAINLLRRKVVWVSLLRGYQLQPTRCQPNLFDDGLQGGNQFFKKVVWVSMLRGYQLQPTRCQPTRGLPCCLYGQPIPCVVSDLGNNLDYIFVGDFSAKTGRSSGFDDIFLDAPYGQLAYFVLSQHGGFQDSASICSVSFMISLLS